MVTHPHSGWLVIIPQSCWHLQISHLGQVPSLPWHLYNKSLLFYNINLLWWYHHHSAIRLNFSFTWLLQILMIQDHSVILKWQILLILWSLKMDSILERHFLARKSFLLVYFQLVHALFNRGCYFQLLLFLIFMSTLWIRVGQLGAQTSQSLRFLLPLLLLICSFNVLFILNLSKVRSLLFMWDHFDFIFMLISFFFLTLIPLESLVRSLCFSMVILVKGRSTDLIDLSLLAAWVSRYLAITFSLVFNLTSFLFVSFWLVASNWVSVWVSSGIKRILVFCTFPSSLTHWFQVISLFIIVEMLLVLLLGNFFLVDQSWITHNLL